MLHGLISLWRRLSRVGRRDRLDQDLDDELAFHLAMRQAEHAGADASETARAARRQFGNVTHFKEQSREMWTFPSFESFVQDVRYALRTLRRSPGFTAVAIVMLAVGIGGNTAMFSLVESMFVRGLPYPDADRLVVLIGNVERASGVERRGNSYPDHLDWRTQSTSFDDMAAYTSDTVTVGGADQPERVPMEYVSASYFSVLGLQPARGRMFRHEEDEVPNRDAVLVLSDGFWKRSFGADPGIIGRSVVLGGRPFEVIGVMPPGVTGVNDAANCWLAFANSGYALTNRGSRGFQTVARLKRGVGIERARAELTALAKQLERAHPDTNEKRGVEVSPLNVETFGQLATAVSALMGAVVLVLLIACANVASLLIGRSEARRREVAVRAALGAGQRRLMRQLITEGCVLTSIGALAGLAVARVTMKVLVAASPFTFPSFVQPSLSLPVLLFTAGAAIACGVLLGLAPAWHARVGRFADALKSSRGSIGASTQRLRSSLAVAEVALAVMLAIGAGLMIRTMQHLLAIDPGFATESVLTLNFSIPRAAVPATPSSPASSAPQPPPALVASSRALLEHVRAVPGVAAASLVSDVPLAGNSSAVFYAPEGDSTSGAQTMPRAYVHRIRPEFFETMRIPLRQGRTFEAGEMSADSVAVIVSEAVGRRFWPGQGAIGKRIKIGRVDSANPWLSIVGVVPDVKYRALPDNPTADPDLYLPFVDRGTHGLVLRTTVAPASVEAAVRAAVREVHPGVVVFGAAPLRDLADAQTAQQRFTSWLLSVFAMVALGLAVMGVYGVMAQLVAQRGREFGIRLALGASRGQILSLVLGGGTRLIGLGLVIGSLASLGARKVLGSLLYQTQPLDASAAVAVMLLAGAAFLATAVPAFRATRTDPAGALRAE